MKRRLLIILAALVVILLVSTTAAMAAGSVTDETAGTVTIEELVPGIETYDDAECTTPSTLVDFDGIKPGQSANVTIYVKNTGELDFYSVDMQAWKTGGGAIDFGTMDISDDDFTLAVGNVQPVTLTLTIDAGEGPRTEGLEIKAIGHYY